MPKGNDSYFGVKLGEALAGGAEHISNALQRKYELQRQAQIEQRSRDEQKMAQEQAMTMGMATKGIPYDPMNPSAAFESLAKSAQAQQVLSDREKEADIAYKTAQVEAVKNKPITPSKGQAAVDVAFGKEYANYAASGGFADVVSQIKTLEEIKKRLETGKENLTGKMVGLTPQAIRVYSNPKSIEAQQQVEQTIQRTLRQTLGAQFTENEGKLFMQRGYDPRLPEVTNAKKLDILLGQLKAMANAKQSAMEYYDKNGTLSGYKGSLYTLNGGVPTKIKPSVDALNSNIPVMEWSPEKEQRLLELRSKMGE